jgi:hypothetical protein
MKFRQLASLLAAPVLASHPPLATSASAQDPSLPPIALANGNDPFGSNSPSEKRFDLEIPADLPVEEAIALVSRQSGQPVNVIWTGGSAQTLLPALRLHQVTVRELLNAISATGQAEQRQGRTGYLFQEVEGASNIFTFITLPAPRPANPAAASLGGGGAGPGPTHPLKLSAPRTGGDGAEGGGLPVAGAEGTGKTSEFFDVEPLLGDDLKVEDLTTAIRTAWTAAGDEDAPPPSDALRYHQETQLLIVTGHREQLAAVRSLIDLLKRRYAPSQDDKDRKILDLQRALENQNNEHDRLRKMLDEARLESDKAAAKARDQILALEIQLAKVQGQR